MNPSSPIFSKKRQRPYSKKVGLPPGSLIYAGEATEQKTRIQHFIFDEYQSQDKEIKIQNIPELELNNNKVHWLNVEGLNEVETFKNLGNHFGLHPLLLEDMMHPGQRPKFEESDQYIYLFINSFANQQESLEPEQVCLVLGKNYVLTVQEKWGDEFEKIRERIRTAGGRIRKMQHDYLFYTLIDAIIDYYYIILDKIMLRTDSLQQSVLSKAKGDLIQEIYLIRQDLFQFKKSVWPAIQAMERLLKSENPLISEPIKPFIKDPLDHLFQISDGIDSLMEMIRAISDSYFALSNQKLNEVMKVLTVFSSIFLPLSFIAGIYGMNFNHMPELSWQYGYPSILGVMFFATIIMLFYTRRKGWW